MSLQAARQCSHRIFTGTQHLTRLESVSYKRAVFHTNTSGCYRKALLSVVKIQLLPIPDVVIIMTTASKLDSPQHKA